MLDSDSVLITGGTGSFGKAFVKKLLTTNPEIKRLVVFSRDELKQFEMAQEINASQYPGLRFFLGDVRDANRVETALEGIDTVVHAAALKQVAAGEYNPTEFIKTNIFGAENVIRGAIKVGVTKVVALSTDKACSPSNLYGATKLCSDRLFLAANNIKGTRDIRFSIVRYGNVLGSRGSILPTFQKQKSSGVLKITDPRMTRFCITLEQAIEMVFWALNKAIGGEVIVPKIPSFRLVDFVEAFAPECKIQEIGPRPGEKIDEQMIDCHGSELIFDIGKYFILADESQTQIRDYYSEKIERDLSGVRFKYDSGTNADFLSIEEIKELIAGYQ